MLAIVLLLEQYRVSHFTPYTNWKLCCCFWLFSSPCNNRYKLYCWEVASSCLESVPLCVPQCSWWEHPVFLSFQYMRASACRNLGHCRPAGLGKSWLMLEFISTHLAVPQTVGTYSGKADPGWLTWLPKDRHMVSCHTVPPRPCPMTWRQVPWTFEPAERWRSLSSRNTLRVSRSTQTCGPYLSRLVLPG